MAKTEDASPICRGKNLSWDTILLFYNNMPREAMPKAGFNAFTEAKINGWTQTHSQIARQLAFYYEEKGICYPRFTKETSYKDLFAYMQNWATKYFIPNPYAPSLKDHAPTCIYASIVEAIKSGQSDFDTIVDSIFNVELSSHDKVKVYLSNFTDLVFDKKTVSINTRTFGIETNLHPDTELATDAKKYFDYFSIESEVVANTHRVLDKETPLQQIFYGAPGTGKSHEIKKQTIGEQVIRTTFHPDSDYSTFVGAYKPTTKQVPMRDVTGKVIQENKEDVTEDRIIYEFVEQAFLQAYTQAWRLYANADDEQPQKQFLVIEEINRGNCAQIFGDLFQLLDRNDAGFSEYPIKADRDMRKQLAKAFAGITITDKSTINQWYDGKDVAGEVLSGEVLLLPSNLFIWATMNTSDQSLFPIDSAFKRRWDWQYIPISNANKGWKIKVNGKQYDWWDFLEKMNEQINATTNSEDKKMGYFFCKAKDGIIDAKTFVGKVVFYVWNDVFKDFANEAGGIFKDEDDSLLSFNKFYHVVNGKTEVLEDKVELLLNNLGVVAEGETIDVEELEKNASANSSKNYLKEIVFPDGTIYSTSEMTHFDAYMAAIRKIGIEKVASVADKLKYRRLNRPLISAEKYEEIENSAGFSYYQEGSYFFVKGVMTYTLVRILEDLNEMLNVGMTINN
jgi:hypothetical protein